VEKKGIKVKSITESNVRDILKLSKETKIEIKTGEVEDYKDVNYSGYTKITILPSKDELKGKLDDLIRSANNQKNKLAIFSDAKPNFGGGITWMMKYNKNEK